MQLTFSSLQLHLAFKTFYCLTKGKIKPIMWFFFFNIYKHKQKKGNTQKTTPQKTKNVHYIHAKLDN